MRVHICVLCVFTQTIGVSMLLYTYICYIQQMDNDELLKCMVELVRVDKEWTPKAPNCSLYIRPTMIGTNVCMYVSMYVRMYLCMYLFMYVCTYVRTYVRTYVCMYVYLYLSICTVVYIGVCVLGHVICVWMCMYMH